MQNQNVNQQQINQQPQKNNNDKQLQQHEKKLNIAIDGGNLKVITPKKINKPNRNNMSKFFLFIVKNSGLMLTCFYMSIFVLYGLKQRIFWEISHTTSCIC